MPYEHFFMRAIMYLLQNAERTAQKNPLWSGIDDEIGSRALTSFRGILLNTGRHVTGD
jgi:hypothetical protein